MQKYPFKFADISNAYQGGLMLRSLQLIKALYNFKHIVLSDSILFYLNWINLSLCPYLLT